MNTSVPKEADIARSLLDQLLEDSRLYRKGSDYKNLLNFVVRLRNFAPFNALLLHIQKPGLTLLGLAVHTKVEKSKKKDRKTLSLFPENAPEPTDLFGDSN